MRLPDCPKPEIALCAMIQEAFQRRLNVMAPTAGHHGYTPTMPH
jgi:hypothetical protein